MVFSIAHAVVTRFECKRFSRRDVPVGIPLDLSTMEWHELPRYDGIQVSQLI